jgi:hypothetical protein
MLKAGTEDSGRIFIRHGLYRRGPVRLCEAVQCVERNVCGGSDTRIAHGRLPNVDTVLLQDCPPSLQSLDTCH